MKHKGVYMIIIAMFIGLIGFSGWKIWQLQKEYKDGADLYDEVSQFVVIPPEPSESKEPDNSAPIETQYDETASDILWPEIDFNALREINSDIVGWIYIEGTEINYPIVQGEDNSYYLKHLFSGEWNSSGCLFLDSRNALDFSDIHSVIYGHHMKNGSMFSGLDNYKRQDYYDEHQNALLLTPDGNYQITFFAGYVASVEDDAWKLGFRSDEFENWYSRAIEKSCFQSDTVPAVTDRIITLSTCSYEFNNARFVVLGILQ